MARIAVTTYRFLDDLTQEEVPKAEELETVTLSIDGRVVELDLTTKNARHLRKQLNPFMRAGRQANLSRYKTTLKSGRPAWADRPELLEEPKAEAPKPLPVDPPKAPPAPVVDKPEPKPATEPAPKSLPQIVSEAKREAGDRAVTATRPAGAAVVPQPTKSPEDNEDEIDWAQWAPNPKDNQRKRGEKRRAWCRARGYTFGARGKLPEAYDGQYETFYRNASNWAPVPPREDLLTNTSKALADAASRVR